MFATEARAPPVVHDHISQQVFTDEGPEGPVGIRGLLQYVVNLVVSMCYNTMSSVLNILLSLVRTDERRCKLVLVSYWILDGLVSFALLSNLFIYLYF